VVKPVMSSSGHGQSVVKTEADIRKSWDISQHEGRTGNASRVIVEGFVPFDYEITLLTVRHVGGTSFLEPVGHHQVDGDYQESWQPQPMRAELFEQAKVIAKKITDALGGRGIFGVELFVCKDEVLFSEVSPRPHDTGMVTLISEDLSEFALHARAILGLPIPNIAFHGPSASKAIVCEGDSKQLKMGNLEKVLAEPNTSIRLFGKPELKGHRRMGVLLARSESVEKALDIVMEMRKNLKVDL
jgi:phosphoribosylglycinamide formyltransferase 2